MKTFVSIVLWLLVGWKIYKIYRKHNPKPQQTENRPAQQSPFVQTQAMPLPANLDYTTPRTTTPMNTRDKRIAAVTQSLYRKLTEISSEIGAFTYYLPCQNEWFTAQYKRGIPYVVTFATKQGLRCFLFENSQNSDTVRCLKEVYLLDEECVLAEEKKTEAKIEAPKATIEELSKEWWVKNWPALEGEINFVNGRKEITLGEKYRIPTADILPFVKQYLETATKGSYTFDSINEDLIGLAVPVIKEPEEVEE